MKHKYLCIITTFYFLFLTNFLIAQDGVLDPTFGSSGIVTTSVGSGDSYGKSTAIQPDGKILVVGSADNVSNSDFLVSRYNSDGTLDNSFGTSGKVIIDFGGGFDVAQSLVIQSNGRIVVAGFSGSSFALVRLNTNGTLDNSFDVDGKVLTAGGKGFDVALQADGKIIVTGNITSGGVDDDFAVIRYNSDGSLDTSFDTDGIVTTNISFWYDFAKSVVIQSDGKIVVAGDFRNGSQYDFAVVRYNADGSLDTSFDTDGIVTTDLTFTSTQSNDLAYSAVIQPDGKIVVGGVSSPSGDNYFAFVRYNTNGSLDGSFDSDGKVVIQGGFGLGIASQSDAKFIITGYHSVGTGNPRQIKLARINGNGSVDGAFGSSGLVTTTVGTSSEGHGVAVQTDGRIIVVGQSYNGSNYVVSLARYNNPSLPVELTTFSASINKHSIELNWETATEVNNYGFEVERNASTLPALSADRLSMTDSFIPSGDEGWEMIAFVQGHGNSNSPKYYSYSDKSINLSGKYLYRLKQIDIDGSYEYSDQVEVDLGLPSEFKLSQNYPNPFNPTTTISYSIPPNVKQETQEVKLTIYDVLGKKVATLVNQKQSSGNYQVQFDASSLPSGVYYYKLRAGNFVQIRKMMLLK